MSSSSHRRRLQGQDGAAAVEFGIISVLVFALVFGMFSGAMAWNAKQALTHSAREGVRFGATLPPPPSDDGTIPDWAAWKERVADVAIEAAYGELNTSLYPDAYVCVAYIPSGEARHEPLGPATSDEGFDDTLALSNDPNLCYDDSRDPTEERIQVLVARPHEFQFILGAVPLALRSRAITRHEVTVNVTS